MSIAVVDRRRVLAFAEALERMGSSPAPSRGETHGEGRGDGQGERVLDPELAACLGAVARLRDEGAAGPSPTADFRAALRERLLEEASTLPAAAAVPAPRGAHRRPAPPARPRAVRWRRRCAVAGTALVFTAGGLGGIAMASSDALPGDMTYGVKRAVEDIQVSMAGSDRERGERYLEHAKVRLAEAEQLLDRAGEGAMGKSTIGHLRSVLADMREETARGRALLTESYESSQQTKIGPMRDLADFARSGSERMERIDNRLPGEVLGERDLVWDLLYDIRRQVTPIPGVLTPQHVDTFDKFDKAAAESTKGPGGRGTGSGAGRPAGPAAPPPQAAGAVPGVVGLLPLPGQPATGGTAGQGGQPSSGSTGNVLPNVTVPLLEPGPTTSQSTPAQSPAPLDVELPAPALPPVGLNIPPLLPGLPGIGITIGGTGQTPPAESDGS